MIKTPFVFAAVTIAIMGSWFAYSDNSPFNACEPTDEVRILLGGREYHIPVEWQPSISRKYGVSFPRRFGYEDHTGKQTGRGTYVYCQSPEVGPEEYDSISFDPKMIERVTPGFLPSRSEFKYLPKLNYFGIDQLGENARPLAEPTQKRIDSAFSGMYWKYQSKQNRSSNLHLFYLYSKNWLYESAPVRAYCYAGTLNKTYSCTITANLNSKTDNVYIMTEAYHGISQKYERYFEETTPQRWPDALQEITELMRSFEVNADQDG